MAQSIFQFTGANGSSPTNLLTAVGATAEIQSNGFVSTSEGTSLAALLLRDTGTDAFDIEGELVAGAAANHAALVFRQTTLLKHGYVSLNSSGELKVNTTNGGSTLTRLTLDINDYIANWTALTPSLVRIYSAAGDSEIFIEVEGAPTTPPSSLTASFNLGATNHGFRVINTSATILSGALEDPNPVTDVTGNTPPVANAGVDGNVDTGQPTILNGSASSDADGNPLNFAWTFTSRPAGSSAAFVDATAESPTFTPDLDGAYVAQLIVNDGVLDSPAVTVTKTASTAAITSTLNMFVEGVAVSSAMVYDTTIINTLTDVSRTEPISWENEAASYTWPEEAGSTLLYVVIIPSAETDAGVQVGDTV